MHVLRSETTHLLRTKPKMFRLFVRCHTTGQRLPLMREIDGRTFLRRGFLHLRTWCPHCGALHLWQKKDIIREPVKSFL